MNSSKYSLYGQEHERYQQYSLELHQKRLKEITKKNTKVILYQNSLKLRKRSHVGSERELDQQNQKFLEKLINIAKSRERSPIRSLSPLPKTLNSILRKKEACRINEENKKIADRIANKSPVLSKKSLEKHYELQSRYKQILAKYTLNNQKRICISKKLDSVDKTYGSNKPIFENKEIIKEEHLQNNIPIS